jgi:hypothetical protein
MLIHEVAGAANTDRIMALSQFLMGRAEDTDAAKSISTDAFIKLARDQGISLTVSQLKDMAQRPPLNNVIMDVTGDNNGSGIVVFKGADVTAGDETMTVDQARLTVDNMAKRAIDIG